MELRTHLAIDRSLCGEVVELADGYAKVRLVTTQQMAADERGLVHGGFTFSAADFAAMAAVNDPYVVLVAADMRFLAPVVVGDVIECEARVQTKEKKAQVAVSAKVEDKEVMQGIFTTYTLDRHVLDKG